MANTTILIVEDDHSIQTLISELFDGEHMVLQAFTVAEALEIAKKNSTKLDLVIADLNLGDGSGLNLVDSLQAKDAQVSAIIMSGHSADIASLIETREGENIRFIAKPFALSALSEMADNLLGISGRSRVVSEMLGPVIAPPRSLTPSHPLQGILPEYRVLVLNRSPDVAIILRELANDFGFCATAISSQQELEKCDPSNFDLLILDTADFPNLVGRLWKGKPVLLTMGSPDILWPTTNGEGIEVPGSTLEKIIKEHIPTILLPLREAELYIAIAMVRDDPEHAWRRLMSMPYLKTLQSFPTGIIPKDFLPSERDVIAERRLLGSIHLTSWPMLSG